MFSFKSIFQELLAYSGDIKYHFRPEFHYVLIPWGYTAIELTTLRIISWNYFWQTLSVDIVTTRPQYFEDCEFKMLTCDLRVN